MYHCVTSKVPVVSMPGSPFDRKYRARMPSSITTEPTRVYRKNLMAA